MITPEVGKEYRVRLHGNATVVRLLEIKKREGKTIPSGGSYFGDSKHTQATEVN